MSEFFDDAPIVTNNTQAGGSNTNTGFGDGGWGGDWGAAPAAQQEGQPQQPAEFGADAEASHASQQPGAADDGLGFGIGAGTIRSASQSQHSGQQLPPGQPDADDGMGFGIPHTHAAAANKSQEDTNQASFNNTARSTSSAAGGLGSLAASTTGGGLSPSNNTAAAAGSNASKVPTIEEYVEAKEAEIIQGGKSKNDVESKKIADRVAAGDKEAADGFAKVRKAADHFHKEQEDSRKSLITKTMQAHRDEQKAHQEKHAKLQRGGNLWEQTHEYIDTAKPPKYAEKNTDRMRNLLKELRVKPNAKQISAAV